MLEFIGELFLLFKEFKFWKKNKNSSNKKNKIRPVTKVLILGLFFILLLRISLTFIELNPKGKVTKERLGRIEKILEKNKKDLGVYPSNLNIIIRNNPNRKGITKDGWDNEFYYQLGENGLNYFLASKGPDNILNTKDDINNENVNNPNNE